MKSLLSNDVVRNRVESHRMFESVSVMHLDVSHFQTDTPYDCPGVSSADLFGLQLTKKDTGLFYI